MLRPRYPGRDNACPLSGFRHLQLVRFSYLVELFVLLVFLGFSSCSFCHNARTEGWSSVLRLGARRHASSTSLGPLSFLKFPVRELVSWLLAVDLCSHILFSRRFDVSLTSMEAIQYDRFLFNLHCISWLRCIFAHLCFILGCRTWPYNNTPML